MNKRTQLVQMGLVLSLMVGCGQEAPQSDLDIVGGKQVEDKTWQPVVGLIFKDQIFCTGTLVAPKLVLTAAHCVTATLPYIPVKTFLQNVTVMVGNGDLDPNKKPVGQYRVAGGNYHPTFKGFRSGKPEQDTAYIRLKDPVKGVKPAKVLYDSDDIDEVLAPGNPSILVGFGFRENDPFAKNRDGSPKTINDKNERLSGVKFEVETEIVDTADYNDSRLKPGVGPTEVLVSAANDRGACKGDSGGPAFGKNDAGEMFVYGITSRALKVVMPLCANERSPTVYGLIHRSLCWIEKDSGMDIPSVPKSYCNRS